MESILVVDRDCVRDGDWPEGFFPADDPVTRAALDAVTRHARPVERAVAEHTPAWKQPIPYCLVTAGATVLCVERLPRQGERRLHGKLSIGLGGHVSPTDAANPGGALAGALARELREELRLPPGPLPPARLVGVVNDEREEVSRVHFGVVFALDFPSPAAVGIRESTKMRGEFRPLVGPSGLWQDLGRFETWSRILLEARAVEALTRRLDPTPHPKTRGKTQEEP